MGPSSSSGKYPQNSWDTGQFYAALSKKLEYKNFMNKYYLYHKDSIAYVQY
jgi:hypothetical protein